MCADWAKYGLPTNAIAPGYFKTPLNKALVDNPGSATMKAVVIHAARDLRVEERESEAPGAGQVEIAVEAGGICGSDRIISTMAASARCGCANR